MLRFLSKRNKEALLLRWFRRRLKESYSKFLPMEEFDKKFKELFGSYPYWYSWHHFYRDHGFVGMRSRKDGNN